MMFVHKVMIMLVGVAHHPVWAAVPTDACDALCFEVAECAGDPGSHNSYCKSDHDPQVCFGLYHSDTNQSGFCFFPNDPTCSESDPVLCSEAEGLGATTLAPAT